MIFNIPKNNFESKTKIEQSMMVKWTYSPSTWGSQENQEFKVILQYTNSKSAWVSSEKLKMSKLQILMIIYIS